MLKLAMDDQTFSLKLSQVLYDIGVTDKIVSKRRKTFLIVEAIDTITCRIISKNITIYYLGSQSEGSTTMNLDSDIDTLFVYHDLNIIQDWNEAKPGAQNVVMVQDDTTSPGHCLLQFKSPEVVIMSKIGKEHFIKHEKGRWLLKNTCFDDNIHIKAHYTGKSGPAHVLKGNSVYIDVDTVIAWHCKYWPKEANQWHTREGEWPTDDMKKDCEALGCIIVPMSSKNSQNEDLEWRISTCLAERRLMFSLNITQMRCYVLMKMICYTFLKREFPNIDISSYVCKTVLFHCIQSTQFTKWKEHNLLVCLKKCLLYLQSSIQRQNCEHFFIPGNNLLEGKIPVEYAQILATYINHIVLNIRSFLMKIKLDCLNKRLSANLGVKLTPTTLNEIQSEASVTSLISGNLLSHIALQLDICHRHYLKLISSLELQVFEAESFLRKLSSLEKNCFERRAYDLVDPLYSSSLASAFTSAVMDYGLKFIPPKASDLFSIGLRSDVSSGKLKHACAIFCTGDMKTTKYFLEILQHEYDTSTVKTICSCFRRKLKCLELLNYRDKANTGNEELIKDIISFCVKFLPCEINCVPHELKYEMYRSTAEDKMYRDDNKYYWMDWAVVDSLPLLYFLQYKVYGRLQMVEKQKITLMMFEKIIQEEFELFRLRSLFRLGHMETAMNLLGQCMEQERRLNDAFGMYIQSLKVRRRNNAANIHICRLLSYLVRNNVP